MPGLSFVTLLAYDYRYAFKSIPSYYALADEIILGLDRDRLTWMKKPFVIDLAELRTFIDTIDVEKKIRIVEGNFHTADHPMANDIFERSELSKACRPGNWVVQIDSDEILKNGPEFKQWLLAENPVQNCVFARWIGIFKAFGDQLLVIDPPGEVVPIATMLRGGYTDGRWTAQPAIMSPLRILHFSWGRSPEELEQKLLNWGHALDFDVQAYFAFWQSVTPENYLTFRNFHPLNGPDWAGLRLLNLGAPAG